MKQNLINSVIVFGILFLSIIYFELIFKIRVLTILFNGDLSRMFTFSLAYSFMLIFILKFFKQKTVRISMYVTLSALTFLYLNHEMYAFIRNDFFSISALGQSKQGLSFLNSYFLAFKFFHILYLVPLLSYYLLNRFKVIKNEIDYCGLKQPLIILGLSFLAFFIGLQTISEVKPDYDADITYSDMDLYTYMYNSQSALKKFGLLTYTQRDFFSLFRTDPLSISEYEVLLENYIENQPEHVPNTYTDLFEDKNFILITAESLDTFAINEELTPNLFYLKENYAYFDNYYSPLYYRSTADTEFLVQTSLYPDKNVTLSMEAYIDNTFPFTLPKLFSEQGYDTYSFHNYTDYFYPRTDFHKITLGYDQYFGSEGLAMLDNPPAGAIINDHEWQSDLVMMQRSIPHFIDSDKFFVNMLTVSGHFRYSSSHDIGILHQEEVEQYEIDNDINLPDEIFWYLAANIEFDLALGYLIDELEAAGKMEDTVIMIFGDHYAYGVDRDTIWEYDDIKEDYDDMDIHNVPMILVSDSHMFNDHIPNFMSSVDILPTVANLFGLGSSEMYKSVFGTDVMSGGELIVRFADMSFVSKDFKYDSLSEQYVIYEDAITDTYLFSLYHNMINDYMYNLWILDIDYFKEEEEDE